jgi:hypothetical protein
MGKLRVFSCPSWIMGDKARQKFGFFEKSTFLADAHDDHDDKVSVRFLTAQRTRIDRSCGF